MAKPIILTGRTELIAAIYDEDNLPSAIIAPECELSVPFCLHSLRFGDERTLDALIAIELESGASEEPTFKLWRFYEDYPRQDYRCAGCAFNHEHISNNVVVHMISESEEYANKTCEECA